LSKILNIREKYTRTARNNLEFIYIYHGFNSKLTMLALGISIGMEQARCRDHGWDKARVFWTMMRSGPASGFASRGKSQSRDSMPQKSRLVRDAQSVRSWGIFGLIAACIDVDPAARSRKGWAAIRSPMQEWSGDPFYGPRPIVRSAKLPPPLARLVHEGLALRVEPRKQIFEGISREAQGHLSLRRIRGEKAKAQKFSQHAAGRSFWQTGSTHGFATLELTAQEDALQK
jgi:hypothetical protein